MKKCFLALLSGLIIPFLVVAQITTDFKPIESKGKIPDEFILLTSEKYNKEKEHKIDTDASNSVKKDQKKFLLESNYVIDNLLLSGKVIFNDPISNYTNKVLAELVKHEAGLDNKIRVYTIKSPAVNAFATDNGIILVTMGLLAQLENEAQLAYILAHEMTHFKFGHSMNSYLETKQIQRKQGKYNTTRTIEDQLIKKNHYSKELEKEADMYGFGIYEKSNYSYKVLSGVFDVLEYSYLPYDLVKYDKTFLETKHLKFPDEYFLENVSEIGGETDYDEDKSTHPSVHERRNTIINKTSSLDDSGRKEFIVSESEFNDVRKLARFELSRLHILDQNYGESLYNSYLLSQDHPNDSYVKKSILQSLYGIAKYANTYEKNVILKDFKRVEGNPQQLFHLINKMPPNELTILALTYAYDLEKLMPEDNEVKLMTNDLFKELITHHYKDLNEFFDISYEELMQKIEEENSGAKVVSADSVVTENEELSKYDKIKRQRKEKKEEKIEKGNEYFLFAFVDLKKDEAFLSRFSDISKELEKSKKRELSYSENRKLKKQLERNGHSLGINKIVFVDPYYFHVNTRKKSNPVNFIANENKMQVYHQQLKENASKANLEADILDGKSLNASDVDAFNDLSLLTEWVNERMAHESMDFVTINSDRIKELSKKYDTKYFAWTGVLSATESRDNIGLVLFYTILFYPLIPYGIYYAVTPQNSTQLMTFVFDVENEKYLAYLSNKVKKRSRKDVINSNLYYFMDQIKRK